MKSFYSRKKVSSSHLLGFSRSPDTSKIYSYFDFDTNSWLKVTMLDFLPYDMVTLQITDSKNPDNVIVCSMDSYRLYKDDLPSLPTVDFLNSEREWREKVLNEPDYIFEYYHSKQGWVKAVVENHKNDVIDKEVVCVRHRLLATNFQNYYINNNVCLCTIHYESKRLAKEGSNTEFYSSEKLQEEKKWIEDYISSQNIEKEKINLLVRRLKSVTKRYVCNNGIMRGVKVYDVSDVYKSLTRDPEPITFERMLKEAREKGQNPDEKSLREHSLYDIAPIGRNKGYDIFWHHEVGRKQLKGPRVCGICNIVTTKETKININGLEISIPKTSFENPLILLGSLSNIEFRTEGEIEYDILEFDSDIEKALRKMNYHENCYVCTLAETVYFAYYAGHWLLNTDDITLLPPETEKEMLESEKRWEEHEREVSKWRQF